MARATYNFPAGFLWGSATAAHQVEGNNTNNDWWALEQEPGRILNGDKSGKACDWWGGRWREDMDRAQDTWQNAHRFQWNGRASSPRSTAGTKQPWIAIATCYRHARTQYHAHDHLASFQHADLVGGDGRLGERGDRSII